MYRSLPQFVAALEADGQLLRVKDRVDPVLEIAQIADHESKSEAPGEPSACARRNDPRFAHLGGRAVLFENVEGADLPVLINALGSYRRMEMAIGRTDGGFDALGERIGALAKPEPPKSLRETVEAARRFAPLLRIPPRTVRSGPCQQVVLTGDDVDLSRLPLIRCWPLDGDLDAVGYPADINDRVPGADLINDERYRGRYITFAGVHTIHAEDEGERKPSSHNIGMYRAQLLGRKRLAMHWHMHHDGARHWRSWKKAGKRMPVAIALGGHSVLPFSAIAPLPPGISELLFAGFLNGRGIPMVPCKTVPVRAPASADIVIEGWVSDEAGHVGYDPREPNAEPLGPGAVLEGPFGDHTGFYSLPDRYPVLEVTAVTMRTGAIYPTTIVGLPPQEDYYMGKAVERLFMPLLRTIVPDVEDYDLPLFGAFHNGAVIKIDKAYPLQARRMMASVWGAGQMAWTKLVIVVDTDVDVHDTPAVLRAVAEHCDPDRDVELVKGPLDILDHAAPALGGGTKLGLDATRRSWGEDDALGGAPTTVARPDASTAPELLERVRAAEGVEAATLPESLAFAWLFIRAKEGAALETLERVMDLRGPAPVITIALGPDADLEDFDSALFHWVANCDPGRDLVRRPGRLGFDAAPKSPGPGRFGMPTRQWPPIIRMDEATVRRVSERADALGLSRR